MEEHSIRLRVAVSLFVDDGVKASATVSLHLFPEQFFGQQIGLEDEIVDGLVIDSLLIGQQDEGGFVVRVATDNRIESIHNTLMIEEALWRWRDDPTVAISPVRVCGEVYLRREYSVERFL